VAGVLRKASKTGVANATTADLVNLLDLPAGPVLVAR